MKQLWREMSVSTEAPSMQCGDDDAQPEADLDKGFARLTLLKLASRQHGIGLQLRQ